MKRKTAHQELVEEADSWVKEIALRQQNGKCLRKGLMPMQCGGGLQGAHILRKGGKYHSIRHELDNVVVMCRNHHMFWAHLNELEFYEWIRAVATPIVRLSHRTTLASTPSPQRSEPHEAMPLRNRLP